MLGIVALIVCGVSLLLNIVGLAIPNWLLADIQNTTYKLGLWKFCIGSTCTDIPDANITDSLKATRALEILGVLLLAGAIACAVLKLVAMKEQAMLPKVAGALAGAAGIFIIIGCIVFAAKYKKNFDVEGFDLHAGFGLCIVAGIGSIVGAVLFATNKEG